jgi:formylglycine-generating enzyme required for sulfatase activity
VDPNHPLPDQYYIDIYEVTAGDYKECVVAGACVYLGPISDDNYGNYRTYNNNNAKDNHPINFVSWDEADAYCAWKEAAPGYPKKRLPTEVEWEKAARGTAGPVWPWGAMPATCVYAVMSDGVTKGCGDDSTWAVGGKKIGKSPYGVYDMAGNTSEWTDSWHTSSQYYRVLRGGSFAHGENRLRSSDRVDLSPSKRTYYSGFRCAATFFTYP